MICSFLIDEPGTQVRTGVGWAAARGSNAAAKAKTMRNKLAGAFMAYFIAGKSFVPASRPLGGVLDAADSLLAVLQ
jgi:hypothetical protein